MGTTRSGPDSGETPSGRAMSPNQQFVLALVLIATVVGVAWYLIQADLITRSDSSLFYSNVVEGLIILGAAFFGVPLSWRAGKSSGQAEGKVEAEEEKHRALRDQRQAIATQGIELARQADAALRSVTPSTPIPDAAPQAAPPRRAPDQTLEVDATQLNEAHVALARLDQLMVDLQL